MRKTQNLFFKQKSIFLIINIEISSFIWCAEQLLSISIYTCLSKIFHFRPENANFFYFHKILLTIVRIEGLDVKMIFFEKRNLEIMHQKVTTNFEKRFGVIPSLKNCRKPTKSSIKVAGFCLIYCNKHELSPTMNIFEHWNVYFKWKSLIAI